MTEALTVIEPDDGTEEARPSQALTLFGTADPLVVIGKASRVALALATVINSQELYTVIGTKKYVHVEGWTLLGSMLGVTAQIEWSRKLENGWEARAIAVYNGTGATVGAGEAQCLYAEPKWSGRDDFALRGMAQTRAISRALRGPLGFVVQLAGFATTPADEMDSFGTGTAPPPLTPRANPKTTAPPPASRTPNDIFNETRAKRPVPTYEDDDAVCPNCGRKEYLRPYKGSYFCSKRDGGCGSPPKGELMQPISYAKFRTQAK